MKTTCSEKPRNFWRSGVFNTVYAADFPGVNPTLQGQNAENFKQIYPEKEYRGLSPNFHIHVSVSELYSHDGFAFSAGGNM